MSRPLEHKSSTAQIRERFENDVERFANLETGQQAVIDAPLLLDLISDLAAHIVPHAHTLLDIGCGAGNNTLKILERKPGLDCDLLDLSPNMLARAKQRVEAQIARHGQGGQEGDCLSTLGLDTEMKAAQTVSDTAQTSGDKAQTLGDKISTRRAAGVVRTFCGDLRSVDLARGRYDIVVAAAVLHHLRDDADWESAFAKIYDITAAGGALFVSDMFFHAAPQVQAAMWRRYGQYLESLGGAEYRQKVFDYIEIEDSPRSMTFQLDLLRKVGFSQVDILHKNACFGAYVAVK